MASKRRDDQRDPVRACGLDADHGERRGEQHAQCAFAAEQYPVGAEAGVPGQGPASEELAEVGGESADEPGEERAVTLEHMLVDRARHERA